MSALYPVYNILRLISRSSTAMQPDRVEEIRGMSTTSSHSTSLLTQITNPNYTQSTVAAVPNMRLLHKSPSEAANRPHVHFATRPSLSESHVHARLPEQAAHTDGMQYVESNIGDFHHNQPQQQHHQSYSAKVRRCDIC